MSNLIFIGSWLLVALIIATSFWFSRYIGRAVERPARRWLPDGKGDAVVLVARLLIVYAVSQYAVTLLALQADTLVVLIAAAVTAVISLSLQTAVGNLINGIVVRSREIFRIGDHVNIGGGLRGKVIGYDFFALWLASVDNETISIPWTKIIEQVVLNESLAGLKPIECPVPLSATIDITQALARLQEVATEFQTQEQTRWPAKLQKKVLDAPVPYPYVVYRTMKTDGREAYVYALVNIYDDRLLDQERSKLLVMLDLGLQDV